MVMSAARQFSRETYEGSRLERTDANLLGVVVLQPAAEQRQDTSGASALTINPSTSVLTAEVHSSSTPKRGRW
jgi:hypothetical protein